MRKWDLLRGFTLIEMVVTLSILSVLIIVMVPNYTNSKNSALIENTAIELLSILETGQFEALKRRETLYVHYVPATTSKGCVSLSFEQYPGNDRCTENNGMARLVLNDDLKLKISKTERSQPEKLFNFSPIDGHPSKNITIIFHHKTDVDNKKVSGVLVRPYAGLRGCSDTAVSGWEKCNN